MVPTANLTIERLSTAALWLSCVPGLTVAAHAITPSARLPEPTPFVGGVSPNELYGGNGAFLAKRNYEDVTNCDGAGVLKCGGGTQYCYSGVNNYLGCCDKGKTCYARTECVPYSDIATRNCDHNTGGCALCTNSAAPNCVRLENAGGQYGIYCDTTAKTTTYDATKVDNPAMSTGVPVGSPGMSFASQGSSTANSAPTSTGDTISGNVDESPGISKGIIAGIIVAAICAVLIGAFLGWHFCIKKNRASHDPSYTHATRGSGDIPLSGYIDHETKSTAASSTFPSPPSRYAKHMSSGPWNAESFEHDTPYTPGPEGAELDSTVVIRDHSPNSGSISSFAGSQHAEQQTPTLSHKVSPLVGSDAQGIQQEPALLDGAEVSAISGHQRHPSAGDSLAQRYTPYRPSRGNGLVSGEIGARETGQSSTFPSYLTPENALGGGFEREEQRLKDEARRSGEHL